MDGPSGAIAPAFTANYDVIAGRVSRGEDILIEEGPDDICAPLLNDAEPHCWRDSVTERDRLAASELGELLPGPIQTGARMTLVPKIVQDMRKAFAANLYSSGLLGMRMERPTQWNFGQTFRRNAGAFSRTSISQDGRRCRATVAALGIQLRRRPIWGRKLPSSTPRPNGSYSDVAA